MKKYNLLYAQNGKWVHGKDTNDIGAAVVEVVFKLGCSVITEPSKTTGDTDCWLVKRCDNGETVACIRELPEGGPTALPGNTLVENSKDEDGYKTGPLKRYRGLTWIGWLNYLVFRWFFFRVFYRLEDDGSISHYGVTFAWPWKW